MVVFTEDVVKAVVDHMRDDHADDNLMIVRAFGYPKAEKGEFVNLDETAGYWLATGPEGSRELKIDWPSGPISERAEIRREVVLLHNAALAKKPLSVEIRESSWNDHDESEGASFMASIMRGVASLEDYAHLVEQHYFMYLTLESLSEKFQDDPLFAPFHNELLIRRQALLDDLEFLFGSDWENKIEAVPATEKYSARMQEIGDAGWIPGLVAHHYTRYLGDLSGGQMISRRVSSQHGFADGRGVEFYDFTQIGDLSRFKDTYREALDALGKKIDAEDRARMLEEVRVAYKLNTEVFNDLAARKNARV